MLEWAGPAFDQQNTYAMDYDGWAETFNVNSIGACAGSASADTEPSTRRGGQGDDGHLTDGRLVF